jgi:Uma2 family endonuclease
MPCSTSGIGFLLSFVTYLKHKATMQALAKAITHTEFRAMEFSEAEERTYVFELINGEIVAKNHPTATHQSVLLELASRFKAHIKDSKLGKVFIAPFGVVLSENTDVQPDLFVVLDANLPNLREDGFFGVPDLVVEVISPSSLQYDRNKKFKLYERSDMGEYWIVDTKNKSIEVYSRVGGVYDLISVAVENGAVASSVMQGLGVSVAEVFA